MNRVRCVIHKVFVGYLAYFLFVWPLLVPQPGIEPMPERVTGKKARGSQAAGGNKLQVADVLP